MKPNCLVSVVMPVYNGERYLTQAIESILNQTFQDFEFVVVNDGSTDKTREILRSYDRLTVLDQENQGVAAASNNGIALTKGKYIARLDADDIALASRLEKQVDFLERNPEIGILGSSAYIIDSEGHKWGIQKMPLSDAELRWMGLFKCPFIHSSVIFRRELVEKIQPLYDPAFAPSDDYELWIRLLKITRGMNLKSPVVLYRVHSKNASTVQKPSIITHSQEISKKAFDIHFPQAYDHFTAGEIKNIQSLLYSGTRGYRSFGNSRTEIILNYLDLWDIYKKENNFNMDELNVIQRRLIIKTCRMAFIPPITSHSGQIVDRLNMLNKNWPGIFLYSMPEALQAFIRERFLS